MADPDHKSEESAMPEFWCEEGCAWAGGWWPPWRWPVRKANEYLIDWERGVAICHICFDEEPLSDLE